MPIGEDPLTEYDHGFVDGVKARMRLNRALLEAAKALVAEHESWGFESGNLDDLRAAIKAVEGK